MVLGFYNFLCLNAKTTMSEFTSATAEDLFGVCVDRPDFIVMLVYVTKAEEFG